MATPITLHTHSSATPLNFPVSVFIPTSFHAFCCCRFKMSSGALPPLPDIRVVLGCGSVSVDFLAAAASYPKHYDKIGSTSAKVQGGGNAGYALTCAAHLGLKPRLISKVADDSQGKGILEELGSSSPFTYVIVDNQTKTRTCMHTPRYPRMIPGDLTESKLLAALDGARLVYFDGRLHETALVVAKEATRRGIPILIDSERKREGLDDLLSLSTYVVCLAKFPQVRSFFCSLYTGAPSVPFALCSMLIKLPIFLYAFDYYFLFEEVDVDDLLDTLKNKKNSNTTMPICVSSKIPPSELVDTTGAGDAFIGAVLYALCANMPPAKMLPFAAQVAGIGCRALGARTGLPQRTDPRLTSFLL
ncbi:hypothetical protein Pfo_006509 [Paulownia fortunei]|nr:hypothetical protein Pfo_006509 [Paulownia fortunei]